MVRRVRRIDAQEGRPVRQQLDHPLHGRLGRLLLVRVLGSFSHPLLLLLLGLRRGTARSTAAASAPAFWRWLLGLRLLLGAGLLPSLALQDRVDQLRLAKPAVTVERQLRGDRMEICEGALL